MEGAEPSTASQRQTDWLARVRDGLGALAALAALVYIAGGFIVGLRLASVKLPTSSVVGQLPRDFLFSVGLGQALFPAIFLAGVYAAVRSVLHRDEPSRWMRDMYADRSRRGKVLHVLGSLAVTALILAPALVAACLRDDSPLAENSGFFWASFALIALLGWLLVLLFLNLQARVARKYRSDFKSVPATVIHSGLVAGILVPGCVAFWGYWPLEEASVCMTRAEGEEAVTPSGYLVGDTSDRVYVGARTGPNRDITSVPIDQVRRLVLGPGAADAGVCDSDTTAGGELADR